MTTSARVGTDVDVLYLEIDLGSQPSLREFATQAQHLADLGGFSSAIVPVVLYGAPITGSVHGLKSVEYTVDPDETILLRPVDSEIEEGRREGFAVPRRRIWVPSSEPETGELDRFERDEGTWVNLGLKVVRTSLASPWVTVISDTAARYAPVGIGATALYGLHHLMKMVMDWQRHREDIQDRRSARNVAEKQIEDVIRDRQRLNPGEPIDNVSEDNIVMATEAIQGLGPITANEMVELDDPRVRGN